MSQLAITLTGSVIGCSPKQRATLKALGLAKREKTVIKPDNVCTQGMLNKVSHLIKVESVKE